MNFAQFFLFSIYIGSMFVVGTGVYCFLNPASKEEMNRFVSLGEILLLGSIVIVGEMMVLSLTGLYTATWLWGAMSLNFLALCVPSVRTKIASLIFAKMKWDLGLVGFIALVGLFMFRNCYFLVDVDSHSTYLFAQKLWLESTTSLVGSPAVDMRIFVPHFNAVPYALGLSIFPGETLFPQLVAAFWTVIVLLLVFGYLSFYRSRWHGLAGVTLILFNDHIFYSGANQFVIINSALIAFLFASAYNFWESRDGEKSFRFFLATVFLLHTLVNKYQVFYAAFFIFILGGVLIQKDFIKNVKWIFRRSASRIFFICVIFFFSLWFLKNFIVTGVPTFPILAGSFNAFNWNSEMVDIFNKAYAGPLSFLKFLKYMSYLFIWPGVHAMKIVLATICALPVILVLSTNQKKSSDEESQQLFYWLSVSLSVVLGFCLVNFLDPRVYRYGIAIVAVAAIFSMDYILRQVLNIKNRAVIAVIILILSLPGYKIFYRPGVMCKVPTPQDNMKVLSNKLHFQDIEKIYFPYNEAARKAVRENPLKFSKAAWDTGIAGCYSLSAFLYPLAPQVGLWHTTVVRWDSYKDPSRIAFDLRNQGIEWVMRVDTKNKDLIFISVEQYAQEASQYNRFPDKILYNYGFPKELSEIQ